MFVLFQFPFVDLRMLSEKEINSLSINSTEEKVKKRFFFPNTIVADNNIPDDTKPPYYRYFGFRRYRNKQGSYSHTEHQFFSNNKLMKIGKNNDYNYRIVYSRLFVDEFFFHFDVAIKIDTDSINDKIDLNHFIETFFSTNLFITRKDYKLKNGSYNLFSLQQYITEHYLYATTRISDYKNIEMGKFLYFGKPAIFLEYFDDKCNLNLGDVRSIKVSDNLDIFMKKSTLIYNNIHKINLWLISKNVDNYETVTYIRKLRICLLKINSYFEGFEGLFAHLRQPSFDFSNVPRTIKNKFINIRDRLKNNTYYGIEWKRIMDLAIEGDGTFYHEKHKEYISVLSSFIREIDESKRKNKKNIIKIEKGGTVIMEQNNANNSNVGTMGGTHTGTTITQVNSKEIINIDYAALTNDITKILEYLEQNEVIKVVNEESGEPEEISKLDKMVLTGSVAALSKETQSEDDSRDNRVLNWIKENGKKVIGVAAKAGCTALVAIIKARLGIA